MNKKNTIIDGNTKIQPSADLMIALVDRMDVYEIGVYYELKAHSCLKSGDGLSQRQIAKALNISVSKVNKALKKFEEKNLIIRKHYNDRITPDDIILKDIDKAWDLNPDGLDYLYNKRFWRWE